MYGPVVTCNNQFMSEISKMSTNDFRVLAWQSLIEAYSHEHCKIKYTVSQKRGHRKCDHKEKTNTNNQANKKLQDLFKHRD